MRLIDADKVLKCKTHGYIDLVTDRSEEVVRVRAIEHAPTVDAVVIPKDATNGDVMKLVFPNAKVVCNGVIGMSFDNHSINYYSEDWWNAQYKQEGITNAHS